MVVPNISRKDQTLKLIEEKDRIEKKINDYGLILDANNVGMTGSLVDDEGFPRGDIDVLQVRNARHQIICLQNDLKELIKEIEKGIHGVHAEAAETIATGNSASTSTKTIGLNSNKPENELPLTPFAKIDEVFPGSPSEDAGLVVQDLILEFGSVNSKNFDNNLSVIVDIVKHKVNQPIPLKIKRGPNGQIVETRLIPRTWNGRGLLGCHILPVTKEDVER